MNWKGLQAIALVVVLAVVLAWFAGAFNERVRSSPTAQLSVAGSRVEVRTSIETQATRIAGTVRPTDETLLGSRVLSTVLAIHVRAGETVSRGDLLVELDAAAASAALEQRRQAEASAIAALEAATLARDRARQVFDRGSLSQADFDAALTAFRRARAERERAAQAVAEAGTLLSFTRIEAPIDGRIVERLVEPGDVVAPGQPLLKLFNPGRLRIEAEVRESLVARVNPGDTLRARIDAIDRELAVTVEEIVPTANPGSRTFLVKALLPTLEDVYPGMFARLEIPVGTREVIRVPVAAVERTGQLTFVRTIAGGAAERRMVRVGAATATGIEVVSGLAAGETLVLPPGWHADDEAIQ